MLNNYLKIAIRSLLLNKVHSFISIFGLALGLAATTTILIVNYSELTWDKNWKDVDRIYELEQIYVSRTTPTKVDTIISKIQLDRISEHFSDMEHIGHVNFTKGDVKVNIGSAAKFNENVNAITTNILDIFSLKAIKGSTTDFYTDKQSVIISESIAKKLFAHEDPIGKTLEITWPAFANTAKMADDNFNYKIIAVIENSPTRSSLKQNMDILVNERYPATPYDPNMLVMSDSNSTYVKLKEGAKPENINSKFSEFLDTNKIGLGQNETKKASEVFTFKITNLRKIHLYGFTSSNNIQRIFILYCLAAVIATLAAVNYINLTTARFARRQKEISLRKTLGATKAQIIAQFLIESLLSVACALLITFIILEPTLPWLSSLLALNIELNYFSDLSLLGIIFGSALTLGLCSGFYPGFILSRIKPAVILKANKSHESSGSIKFRNLLVIFQFSISAAMLVSVGVIATQLYCALNANSGYDTKNIVYLIDDKLTLDKGTLNSLKRKISDIPGVLATSKTMPMLPGSLSEFKPVFTSTQKTTDAVPITLAFINDVDEIKLLNISLIAGKSFVPPGEDGNKPNVIINEQAVKFFGYASATDAIGMTLNINISGTENTPATIIGVTSRLQLGDLNRPSVPLILMRSPEGWSFEAGTLGIRLAEDVDRAAAISQAKDICKQFIGATPRGEIWLQSMVEDQYKSQILIAKFAYTFAALAVFISCLGLYGLASFAAEKRTKEIGLRKVHGASIKDIVGLLLWQFTKPIALANLIAWPIALYAINHWLENFSQRIDLWVWGPVYCLLAAALAIAIAWLTVGGQAYGVARAKPVNALREE